MAQQPPTDPTKTRKDAQLFTVTDPAEAIGFYLAEDLTKTWIEDFTDGDTGEVVSINRCEIIKRRGELITPDIASSLIFYIQTGDVTEIKISDQRRQASEYNTSKLKPYKVTASINGKRHQFILEAQTVELALEVARDWIELNYKGTFGFTAVAMLRDVIIIEPAPVDAGDRDAGAADIEAEKQYYKADVDVTVRFMETGVDPETYNFTCIIKTLNADTAKEEAAAWVEKRKGAEVKDVRPTLIMAAPYACTEIISREFCVAYRRSDDKQSKNQ